MKHLATLILLAISFTLISCNNSDTTEKIKIVKATDKNGPEYQSDYICPMYCKSSGSKKPGQCPACKMDYVLNPNKKNAHDHSGHHHNHDGHHHDHSGHDHSHEGHHHDHSGHDHDHDGDGIPDH